MKKLIVLFLITLLSLAVLNCSDRDNPVDVNQPSGLYFTFDFTSQALSGSVLGDFPGRNVLIYTPPGYDTYDHRTRYPVLYLLHGYGGDHNYYRGLYGLAETMDEMINSGEIEPMIIVMPDASNGLGGGFYTNSPDAGYPNPSFAGLYADFITDEVIDSIDFHYKTIADRRYRGIAGHSMGGYGAVKLAMERNDLFGSAASMSGPLAFYGGFPQPANPTFSGIVSLIPSVFAENGVTPGDTAGYYSIAPASTKRLTSMMFAMAAAFSPHDTSNADTSTAHYFLPGNDARVNLPFDVNGDLDSTVWSQWMANDVTGIFILGGSAVFDSTDLYVDAGDEDDLYLNLQANVFAIYATSPMYEVDVDYEIYSGLGDRIPADHASMIGERLRNVLRFHNESFTAEPE